MKFKSFLFTLLFFARLNSISAQVVSQDINGRPYRLKGAVDVEGSAFLNDDWQKATVKLSNGKTYKDASLKFNLADNELLFKGKDGEPFTFMEPVSEFAITDDLQNIHTYRNDYSFEGESPATYFEVLADGTTQLLKKTTKSIGDFKEYNGPIVKKYVTSVKYYLYKDKKAIQIKPDRKSLLYSLGSKQAELDTYIKNNNLNLKQDADLGKVVVYFNSI
ncbi:hypothetical protein [Mucilaginibacter terrae]|uniref:Outer membrane lipoprotein-sorting protein n=1 Tax=Mucilaginibacter terrae TaxID=1955052 RepID=A0ABU3GZM9_9SPHI|nr:hypothetical protein [Mucilaginibacter terrae]MDT3405227.1 hypothetical protein [Mucilaginibacter terrae]